LFLVVIEEYTDLTNFISLERKNRPFR